MNYPVLPGQLALLQIAEQTPHETFDGATFDPKQDAERLTRQLDRVLAALLDGEWHTLPWLARKVGCETQSASARLRDLRKKRFGAYLIERRRKVGSNGLFEYRLLTAGVK